MKQINVRVEDELHRAIKTRTAAEGKTITSVVVELLTRWIANGEEAQTEENQEK